MSRQHLFTLTKKDFIVETFRCGGNGGQNVNKVETGVRIRHPASGAIGESREERHQFANKKIAFKRLANSTKFKNWVRLKAAELSCGKSIEQIVEEMMQEHNIKTEVKDDKGRWKEISIFEVSHD